MESEEAVEALPAWKNGDGLGEVVDIFRCRSANPRNTKFQCGQWVEYSMEFSSIHVFNWMELCPY